MDKKQMPSGICDLCGEPIPKGMWYTSKGKPRLYCSLECRQTAISQQGNPKRVAKLRERIAKGSWKKPRKRLDAETIRQLQSNPARKGCLREIAEGSWCNPALSREAHKKLSRSLKHTGVLHQAIEKLYKGSMGNLTDAERQA